MATQIWRRKGEQFLDNAGAMLREGKLYFYEAGTTDLQTTYANAAGTVPNTNPLVLDGYGRLQEAVYFGSAGADYKELLTTSGGATIAPWPADNLPKAVAEIAVESFAAPLTTWTQVTSAASPMALVAGDLGKAYECDTSAGDIEFDLPAASLCTNKSFLFKKTATANSLILDPNGSETIDDVSTSITITAKDTIYRISSNGAEWYLESGVVTGDNLGRGLASLTEETTAFDRAADFLVFQDTSASYPKRMKGDNAILPGAILAIIEDRKAVNTAGGKTTSGAIDTRVLNTLVYNRNSIVSLSSNQFTLPAGSYYIQWSAPAYDASAHQSWLFNVTDGTVAGSGTSEMVNGETALTRSTGSARVTIAASKAFTIRHLVDSGRATNGYGFASNITGLSEVYTRVEIFAA